MIKVGLCKNVDKCNELILLPLPAVLSKSDFKERFPSIFPTNLSDKRPYKNHRFILTTESTLDPYLETNSILGPHLVAINAESSYLKFALNIISGINV